MQSIPLEQARPGMVLATDLIINERQRLSRATVLNEEHLTLLKLHKVSELSVVPNDTAAPATAEIAEIAEIAETTETAKLAEAAKLAHARVHEEVERLFRRSGNEPVDRALRLAVLEYRLEKRA